MPHDPRAVEAARAWLGRARSNLALSKQEKPSEAVWEDLCFNAQQAAEKALKSILTLRAIDFPKTHDIEELLDLLDKSGQSIPESLRKGDRLTQYAVELRYPFPETGEEVSEEDYRVAVAIAQEIVEWAEKVVGDEL